MEIYDRKIDVDERTGEDEDDMSMMSPRELSAIRKAAGVKPARRPGQPKVTGPAATDSRRGESRSGRHCVDADTPDFDLSFMVPIAPQPKRRARTSIDFPVLKKCFLQSGGSLAKFLSLLRSQPVMKSVTPAATRAYEQAIRLAGHNAMAASGQSLALSPVMVEMSFIFAGSPDQLPTSGRDGDLDNLAKAVLDALNTVAYRDDRQVARIVSSKSCADNDGVYVRVTGFRGQ